MPANTILVIDDDRDIRESLALLFEGEGYEVQAAADGLEGMRALQQADRPLIVLLDLLMPRMSGFELLRWLGQHPAIRDRHAFIVFSARTSALPPGYRQVLQQLKIETVPKPGDVDRLLTIVKAAGEQLALANG